MEGAEEKPEAIRYGLIGELLMDATKLDHEGEPEGGSERRRKSGSCRMKEGKTHPSLRLHLKPWLLMLALPSSQHNSTSFIQFL